jgi:hypothetical protein
MTGARCGLIAAVCAQVIAALWGRPSAAQAVTLRPGLLVDPARRVAYVMAPGGRIAAVDLGTGVTRWSSSDGAMPLALVGDRLIALVEPRTAGNRFELAALNTKENGTRTVQGAVELPAGVRVSIGQSLAGTFSTVARPSGGNVIVSWSFVPARLARGMLGPEDSLARRGEKRIGRPGPIRGALSMNPATGNVRQLDTTAVPALLPPQWIIPRKDLIAAAAATQYLSVDGRHVLASELVGDDRVWDKYRWTIYERASGRRLGELRTYLSFSPFLVQDSLVVFETTPFGRRGEGEQPAKLRAVSVVTGAEVWGVEVRELVYRGPVPP